MLSCEKISASIKSLQASRGSFDLLCRLDLIRDCLALQREMLESIREIIVNLRDPDETRFRNKLALKYGFEYVESFHGGHFAWAHGRNKVGYQAQYIINRSGQKWSPDISGSHHSPFYLGYSWVYWRRADQTIELSLVDAHGKEVKKVPAVQEIDISDFEKTGLIYVQRKVGDGFVPYLLDYNGELAFENKYVPLTHLRDGLAWAYDEAGRRGKVCIIGDDGEKKATLDFQFRGFSVDEFEDFSDGVAWARIGKTWRLYSAEGKILYETSVQTFRAVYPFRDGVSLIEQEDGFYFVDKTGKKLAGPYEDADEMNGGTAPVSEDKFDYHLLRIGEIQASEKYFDIRNFANGVFFAKERGGNYVLINNQGKRIGNEEYDKVIAINDEGVAMVVGADGWIFSINTLGERVFTKFVNTNNKYCAE